GQVRFGETRGSSIVLHTWLRHPFRTDESSRCLSEFQSVACTRRRGTRREEICKEGRLGSFHGTRWSGSRPRLTSFIAGVELEAYTQLARFSAYCRYFWPEPYRHSRNARKQGGRRRRPRSPSKRPIRRRKRRRIRGQVARRLHSRWKAL